MKGVGCWGSRRGSGSGRRPGAAVAADSTGIEIPAYPHSSHRVTPGKTGKMSESGKLAQKLTSFCRGADDIEVAYLFGSRAGGRHTDASDVDVGILFGAEVEFSRVDELEHQIRQHLGGMQVDVVQLNTAPPELAFRVIDEGTIVFEVDEATRVDLEAHILSRYGDYLPILKQQRRDMTTKGDSHERAVQRYREALGETERLLEQTRAAHRKESE